MEVRAGDCVMVNLAAFIGWVRPSKDSIPCQVAEVEETRIRVITEPPYRKVELWIPARWIAGILERA